MSCETLRGLLPLFVEGDCAPGEADAVRSHLATCAACRDEEALLRASQAFWKRTPEHAFDEAFHADVRRRVRASVAAETEARERRRAIWRGFGALAGAAAALELFFVLFVPRPRPAPAAAQATPSAAPVAAPAPSVAALPEPSAQRPAPRFTPRRQRPVSARAVRPPTAAARVTRIEMSTPNPSVRVIWLANAS